MRYELEESFSSPAECIPSVWSATRNEYPAGSRPVEFLKWRTMPLTSRRISVELHAIEHAAEGGFERREVPVGRNKHEVE
jgi:hypothetical protein